MADIEAGRPPMEPNARRLAPKRDPKACVVTVHAARHPQTMAGSLRRERHRRRTCRCALDSSVQVAPNPDEAGASSAPSVPTTNRRNVPSLQYLRCREEATIKKKIKSCVFFITILLRQRVGRSEVYFHCIQDRGCYFSIESTAPIVQL